MPECEWMPPKLTNEIIEAAIEGFAAQKRRIDEQIAELRGMRAGSPAQPESASKRPRRKLSAAARKKMAEGQRKRSVASKGESSEPKPAKKPKRKLSAAGRANIVAALKKRWAAKKAAAKK
jgi:hypothetical protein